MTTFNAQTGTSNPFNNIDVGFSSAPTFADIDGDGDLDAIIGKNNGTLKYYKNTGSAVAPLYALQTGGNNLFNSIDVGDGSVPTFADIDGDGDLDAVIGEYDGILNYYKNTGSSNAPIYVAQTGTSNPLNGIKVGFSSTPTFADLDGDSDLDVVIGDADGTLSYYKNTGSATAPVYTAQTGNNNPFDGITVGLYSAPTFADIDGDGDLDAIIGSKNGTLQYYKNTGSAAAPVYTAQTGTNNPFDGITVGLYSAPTFADIDGDGDRDLIVGEFDGTLNYFLNTSSLSNRPPIAVNDTVSTTEDAVLNGNVLSANPTVADSDPDGNALTVSQVNGVAANVGAQITLGNGKLTVNANGTFSFNPNGGYESLAKGATATETFTYTISDGIGGTATATVTVNITGANDAPIVASQISGRTLSAYSFLNFAIPGTFSDVDTGDVLTYAAVVDDGTPNGAPLPSWLTFNASTQSFQGFATDENIGLLNIKVTATDSAQASASATFALNVVLPTTNTTNTILGTPDPDVLQGTANNDLIKGWDGNDILYGNAGDDTINGEGGNDILKGGIGNDILNGGIGNDQLFGDDGNDILVGSDGNDILKGGNGNDILDGGIGNDSFQGGNGDDLLFGGAGDDILYGDAGNDTLWGGIGNDVLFGGTGRDQFGLQAGLGSATIRDFSLAESDVFKLGAGLSYGSLSFSQNGSDALIIFGSDILATVSGVQASLIADSRFFVI
jgi:VCBS repeat-containing protein